MSFWLSSPRFLSLNRALWEIPPPAMWPLCPHSYRTRRTVWSTVPLTREEAKTEVKPRAPGLAGYFHRTCRDVSLIQLKKKKKGSKEPKWIIYLPTGGSCWTFPFTSRFWLGLEMMVDILGLWDLISALWESPPWAWWDTGSRPVWSRNGQETKSV